MKKARSICVMALCAALCHACAVSEKKLGQYSSECGDAEKAYKTIYNTALPKVLYFVEYEGWTGDSQSFQLRHPVFMKIRFGGYGEGYYHLRKKEENKHIFSIKTDWDNNIELTETDKNGNMIYVFRGKNTGEIIKGVWRKGRGREAFAFYVKSKRQYGPLSRH